MFLYYPVHAWDSSGAGGNLQSGIAGYEIAVPRHMALKFHIASRDLRLGAATGATLPGNASEQAFQHATGDPNPASFKFTVLGVLP